MKKMNSIRIGIYMILFILFFSTTLKAQELTFTQAIDSLFAPLDKNRISTGILYERVMPLANIDLYNSPSENPPASNYKLFKQSYFELYNASYNKSNWILPSYFGSWADGEAYEGRYTLGILDYQFNMIDSNAVNNGHLSFTNGQFHDVSGAPSPYLIKRFQMASILTEKIPSGFASIKYNPDFIKTNLSIQVSTIILNFGSIGTFTLSPSSNTVQINFTGSGIKDFTVTVNYSNGSSFTNSSQVQIGNNTGSYNRINRIEGAVPSPNTSFWISSKYSYQGYEETQAYYGKAKISIWWKLDINNIPVPGITKPIIIVDGIDAFGERMDTAIYKLFSYDSLPIKNIDFADQLRKNGFDIIVMDMPTYTKTSPVTINDQNSSLPYPKPLFDYLYPDQIGLIFGGADYIQRNAFNLERLIDHVNQEMIANSSNEKIVLIGPSMGGQITRYALRDMERRGQNHNCRLWVSFDSPHQGAYVPMGLQHSINKLSDNSIEAQKIRDVWINSPTAQQTALHHYKSLSEQVAGVTNFFYPYYSEINDPNFGFPQASGLRKIAMLSGSDLGVSQTFGTACQLATEFEAKYKPRGFLNLITSGAFGYIFLNILGPIQKHSTYLAPASGQCVVFKFHHVIQPDYEKKIFAPTWSNTSLDMLQGGFFPAFDQYKRSLDSANQKELFSYWTKFFTASVKDYVHNGMQEPTYSTLAVGLGSMPASPARKWDENFRLDNFNQPIDVTCPETKESPFDMYWAPDVNTRHDSLLLGHVVRLRKEIIDKQEWPRTQLQRQAAITANKNLLCSGETGIFSISNSLPGMVYNWTPSAAFLQILSGQGTTSVTIKNNGSSTVQGDYSISCQASTPCYFINASYNFHVGVQTPTNIIGFNPPISASPGEQLQLSVGESGISYQWNVEGGTISGSSNQSNVTIQVDQCPPNIYNGYLNVHCNITNACGTGDNYTEWTTVDCSSGGGGPLRVFPNPSSNLITVAVINKNIIKEVKIIDKLGNVKVQMKFTGFNKVVEIDVSKLPPDVYYLQVFNGKVWQAKVLMIKRQKIANSY